MGIGAPPPPRACQGGEAVDRANKVELVPKTAEGLLGSWGGSSWPGCWGHWQASFTLGTMEGGYPIREVPHGGKATLSQHCLGWPGSCPARGSVSGSIHRWGICHPGCSETTQTEAEAAPWNPSPAGIGAGGVERFAGRQDHPQGSRCARPLHEARAEGGRPESPLVYLKDARVAFPWLVKAVRTKCKNKIATGAFEAASELPVAVQKPGQQGGGWGLASAPPSPFHPESACSCSCYSERGDPGSRPPPWGHHHSLSPSQQRAPKAGAT